MERINESMYRYAETQAEAIAKALQVDGVVVLIAHSTNQLAVGYAYDADFDAVSQAKSMLKDALEGIK